METGRLATSQAGSERTGPRGDPTLRPPAPYLLTGKVYEEVSTTTTLPVSPPSPTDPVASRESRSPFFWPLYLFPLLNALAFFSRFSPARTERRVWLLSGHAFDTSPICSRETQVSIFQANRYDPEMENSKATRSKTSARKDPEMLPGGTLVPAQPTKEAVVNPLNSINELNDTDEEGSVDLIAKNPEAIKDVISNTSIPPDKDLATERSQIWAKMKEAQASGDKLLSRILLKAYNDLEDTLIDCTADQSPKLTRSLSALPVLTNKSEEASNVKTTMSTTETELKDNIVYAVGAVTSHQDIGFTPYFDDNIRKLKAPLPLTIFDREWQKKALTAHLMLKPSKNSEDKAYRGLAYHDEWTQSHSAWTNNHRSFYIALRDVYGKGILAEKLRIHKENCDVIADVYGFMTAFRYDMQIRMNAFAHCVPSKDSAAIPDISVKNSVVVEQCYSTVRSYGEAIWKDNLYAPGSSHASYDPDTGTKRPELTKSVSYPLNQQQNGSGSSGRGNHQERRRERRWNNQTLGWGQGYNYFNPGSDQHNSMYSHFNHPFMNGQANPFPEAPHQHNFTNQHNFGYNNHNHPSSIGHGYNNQGTSSGSGESCKRFRGGANVAHDGGGRSQGGKGDDHSGGKQ
ncbi:hypothetical protein PGTUg99_027481 [Puccinia graminis f. sp. tritici]|uniref:Uncharacterized protein n=1 Tax=Puccinia graminis f. sp. tritici TaxID=56615 RepID=A0A5B0R8Q8_PUCGR|nr:hypothetical protein PGTUg99_027481 [Puccinia graminis f. sp. tritici]